VLVRDVMNRVVPRVRADTTFGEAARRFRDLGWTELAVLADGEVLEGVVAIGDILRALFPDLDELARMGAALDAAFEAFLEMGRDLVDQPVARVVIRDPIVAAPDDPLLRIATVMSNRHIHRLFVVDGGRVVGTIGRADICSGALRS
jgi:CBS domain-containing protein